MISPTSRDFQRRFLSLAGWMLACNWEAMGNRVQGIKWHSLEYSLLGLHDYCCEMRLLCQEKLNV